MSVCVKKKGLRVMDPMESDRLSKKASVALEFLLSGNLVSSATDSQEEQGGIR